MDIEAVLFMCRSSMKSQEPPFNAIASALSTHPLDIVVSDAQLAMQQMVLALVLHHLGLECTDLNTSAVR